MNPMTAVNQYRKLQAKANADHARRMAVNGALSGLAMGGSPRVKRDVAQAVLLGSPWLWQGRRLDVVGKSVGAGVWELRLNREKRDAKKHDD